VTNPAKRKGDAAELEIARVLHDLTGWPVRRKLGAGRADDTGDLDGIPDTVAQVKNYADPARAIREALADLEQQRANAGATFAVAFVRRRGGKWAAVMDIEQWATWAREATKP
jgi:hypothetical protein